MRFVLFFLIPMTVFASGIKEGDSYEFTVEEKATIEHFFGEDFYKFVENRVTWANKSVNVFGKTSFAHYDIDKKRVYINVNLSWTAIKERIVYHELFHVFQYTYGRSYPANNRNSSYFFDWMDLGSRLGYEAEADLVQALMIKWEYDNFYPDADQDFLAGAFKCDSMYIPLANEAAVNYWNTFIAPWSKVVLQ